MNLINVFTDICSTLPGSPEFSYMGKYEHNSADHLDFTTARVNLFEIEQPGFKFNKNTGNVRDRFPVFIEFLKKSDQDLTAIQRESIIQDMRNLAASFILTIDQSGLFEELPEIIQGVTVRDRYDTNTAGYEMNLILVSYNPMNICV